MTQQSSTLDDLEGSLRTLSCQLCVFRSSPRNLKEDKPTLSAAKM